MHSSEAILRAIAGQPLAIRPEKLDQIIGFLQMRRQGDAVAQEDIATMQAARAERRGRAVAVPDGVALIPLIGTISHRTTRGLSDGGAKIDAFLESFDAALANSDVGTIVIDFDTPGGAVSMVAEAAERVYAARGEKRIIGVANTLSASAGYWIYSACGERIISPSGEVGSIGVYMIHVDWSQYLADAGFKPTLIKSGKFKAEGHPFFALSEEAHAAFQQTCDDYYELFIDSVAKHTGATTEAVLDGFGQGRCLTAKRAVKEGMADRIGTLESVLAELGVGRSERPSVIDVAAPALAASSAVTVLGSAVGSKVYLPGPVVQGAAILHPERDDAPDAGGAAPDATVPPVDAAREAEEKTAMSTTATAAPGGAAQVDMKVVGSIRALALEHGYSESDAFALATSGKSEAEASRDILNAKGAAQRDIRVGGVHDREADNPQPFHTLGEQLSCVIAAEKNPRAVDKRLLILNDRVYGAAGQNSTVPSEGGYAIQPTFVPGLLSKTWKSSPFLDRCARAPIGENSDALVRNRLRQRSLAKGARFGGIQVYRVKEGKSVAEMKAEYGQDRLELEKMMGVMFVTSEQQRDGVQLQAEAERYVPMAFRWQAEYELFWGTSVGEMLGIHNSPTLVAVPKETGQAAATITIANLLGMLAVLPDVGMEDAVWAVHRTTLPQLGTLKIGDTPVFVPNGNISGRIFGTMYGLPVAVTEFAKPLGQKGDIGLFNFSEYTIADKSREGARGKTPESFEQATSMHVRFLTDEECLRWTWRVNGQPDWDSPLTDLHGTNEISPFAVLAERA